jgi:hypothetical protein
MEMGWVMAGQTLLIILGTLPLLLLSLAVAIRPEPHARRCSNGSPRLDATRVNA